MENRGRVRWALWRWPPIEPGVEDGFDGAIGPGADLDGPLGGGLEARRAKGSGEADDAETGISMGNPQFKRSTAVTPMKARSTSLAASRTAAATRGRPAPADYFVFSAVESAPTNRVFRYRVGQENARARIRLAQPHGSVPLERSSGRPMRTWPSDARQKKPTSRRKRPAHASNADQLQEVEPLEPTSSCSTPARQ